MASIVFSRAGERQTLLRQCHDREHCCTCGPIGKLKRYHRQEIDLDVWKLRPKERLSAYPVLA
jgi:hypothetical protein